MAAPRPTPRRSSPPPRPTPGPPSASQRFLRVAEEEFGRIKKELTAAQRRSIEGISFGTSPSIGQVGGREVAGRTFFRQGPIVTRAVQRVLQAAGKLPGEGIRISEKTTQLPAAIRHETAHALLFQAEVPVKQQHAVIKRARASTKQPIELNLLPKATALERAPQSVSRDLDARRLRQQLLSRAVRRRNRDRK